MLLDLYRRHVYPRCRVTRAADVTSARTSIEASPRSLGLEPEPVASIWRAVERLYESGMHPAVALCLRWRGQVVFDRAIGHARGNAPTDPPGTPTVPCRPDTPFCIASTSKAITAMILHGLDEAGQVRMDDPVCEYIPEFGRHSKDSITLRHILAHRAGVPNPPPEVVDPDLLACPEQIVAMLCDERPVWRPGTRLAYQAVTTGFLLGEIVQRVTGRSIREVLADTIATPLAMRWMSYGVEPADVGRVAVNAFTGPIPLPPVSTMFTRALSIDIQRAASMLNDPRFLASIFPSANIVATADELCRFFELLRRGGELDGVRVYDARTVRRAVAEQSYLEPDLTLVIPFRYSLGFMLGSEWFSLYGPQTPCAFGHIGFTNVIGWADPEREISGALLTSGKPALYPELYYIFEMMRRIGVAFPRTGPRHPGGRLGAFERPVERSETLH